jgi:hypothetical protein
MPCRGAAEDVAHELSQESLPARSGVKGEAMKSGL